MFFVKPLLLISVVFMVTSCVQVGSKRWCEQVRSKPKAEWTFDEAKNYTASCFFKKKNRKS